jgi:hypothetical protein
LKHAIDSLETQVLRLSKAKFELNPGDWIYKIENPGGGNEYYILYSNGSLVETESLTESNSISLGNWNLKQDSLQFHFYKDIYKRGVGKRNNLGGANAPEWAYYSEHVKTIEFINRHERWLWEDWKSDVRKEVIKIMDEKPSKYSFTHFDYNLAGDYPKVSQEKINNTFLQLYKKDDLQLIKNEIYARYGFIFKSENLKKHFSSKAWYKPQYNNVDEYLSDIEKYNIKVINDFFKK